MSLSVAVIIPTYNFGHYIVEAIGSVLKQTYSAAEIIVVDDGSDDDTRKRLAEFGDAVRYIRQDNQGVSAARNRGVRQSRSDLIAFLDADDLWVPTKLAKQAAVFADNPKVGLVHCGMREFESETGKTLATYLDGCEGDVADELLLWERPAVNVSGSAVMVSRAGFERVSGFDTRIKCGEDWDFCYRVAREFDVGFVRETLVEYRSHLAAAHRNVDEMERGMALFYKKAFETDDQAVLALRRRALGNYHRVMAGSYLHAGRLGKFASHTFRSLWMRPANIGYFAAFPFRRFSSESSTRSR